MHLKSITLCGFKSFPDKIVFRLNERITAIVGPNGCGKSNVVDALRWVIGESSAKQMRGASMSDVVFNGTRTRQPLAKASVELLLDNSSHELLGEYAAFSEIAIRREVTRDAHSQYMINGVHVRRRDVIDLFLGTGLGPRSYSVIEQGMISQIIEAKPDELRAYIEEAAGISKYKERRRETSNRMRHTNENMERLNDMRETLDKQLRHLQRQARAAERYQDYQAREQQSQAALKALQWQRHDVSIRELTLSLDEKQSLLEKCKAEQQHVALEIERSRQDEQQASDQFQQFQKQFYAFDADIARIEQQISDIEVNRRRWQLELEQAQSAQLQLNQQRDAQQKLLDDVEAFLANHSPEMESLKSALSEAELAHAERQQSAQQTQELWDDLQQSCAEHEQALQLSRSKLEHYVSQQQSLNEQEQRLTSELDALAPAVFDQQLQALNQQLEHLKGQQSELQQSIQQAQQQISQQRDSNQAIKEVLPALRSEVSDLKARYQGLEALKHAALAHFAEDTQAWLQQHHLDTAPCLLERMHVQPGWEVAIEMVLGQSFDAVCVDDLQAWQSESSLPAGLMLMTAPAQGRASDDMSCLASKVNAPWNNIAVLQHVWVADSLAEAKAMLSKLADNASVITQDGLWLGQHWLRKGKNLQQQESMLVRQASMDTLLVDIEKQSSLLQSQEEALDNGEAILLQQQHDLDALREQEKSVTTELARLSTEQVAVEKQKNAALARREQLHARQQALESQKQTLQQQQTQCQADQDEQQTSLGDLQSQKAEKRNRLEQCESYLQDSQQEQNDAYRAYEKHSLSLSAKQQEQGILTQSLNQIKAQCQQTGERQQQLQSQLGEQQAHSLEDLKQQLQALLAKRTEAETAMLDAQAKWHAKQQQHNQLEDQHRDFSDRLTEINQAAEAVKLKVEAERVRQQTLVEQLQAVDRQIDEVVSAIDEALTIEACEEEISTVQRKIQRLGPINLAAIDEYQTLEERKSYLDAQYEDLCSALELLQNAIRTIDKQTKLKFKDTFDALNQCFQHLFPKVFGGGQAELLLSDDDLLSAGVCIKAQPPGKRNTMIQMLSGGEKAMTAVALVFALFQLNPAPICILDEVDAPLDDTNVGRFCNLLKAMAKEVQFVVISHNKLTIEVANQLMGVTMSEPGVSRLVSVDMEEAVAMVE